MTGLSLVIRQRHHGETHVSTYDLAGAQPADLRCQVCGCYVGALTGGKVEAPTPGRQLVRIA